MKKLVIALIALIAALPAYAQINIWEGTDCKKKVKMTPFIVEGANNPAVIVCPGGSYFWHDTEVEGNMVARWLNSKGISAFVLDYRTGGVPAFIFHTRLCSRGNRYPDPQNDLRQALKLVRGDAQKYGIDPDRVGAMGFSAGGHLVMSSAQEFTPDERPDFIVPVYPVVTMTEKCVHKRSRRGLLGDDMQNDARLKNRMSLERHVPADCPPVFLVNCKDDPIVHYHNSELLDSALTAKGVKHVYIQYETGGHGFGASETKGTPECRQWKERFIEWLGEIGIL